MSVRIARAEEAASLTDLAIRAKASWGYDVTFMERCRAELTITAAKMASRTFWVAEHDGWLAGMVAIATDGTSAELDYFMVEQACRVRESDARCWTR